MLNLMPAADWVAFILFLAAWLFYRPFMGLVSRGQSINAHMVTVRRHWMGMMLRRDNRIADTNLLGHALTTATFFASTNLLIIAAVIGALFGGEGLWNAISSFSILAKSSHILFDLKLSLIVLTMARGLLDFIWGIRQINYLLAVIGAAPPVEEHPEYSAAAASLMNPAMSAINSGVRGYYFALAAGAWLFSPYSAIAATIGAVALLLNRQLNSPASQAVARIKKVLDEQGAGRPQ